MMLRIYTLCLLVAIILVGGFQVEAQNAINDSENIYPSRTARPKWTTKVSLLSIMDWTAPSLNIGSEVQIHPKLGLHMEAGLVSHLANPLYAYINMQYADNYKNWGGKGKLSLRYYFKRRSSGPDVFFGPSIAHTQHRNSQMEWIWGPNFIFQERVETSSKQRRTQFHLEFGFFRKADKDRWTVVESVFGMGFQYFNLSSDNPDYVGNYPGLSVMQLDKGSYVLPSGYIGVLVRIPSGKATRDALRD
ncbi:MAG: hypothetical protein CBD74_13980 [Saprospirales bacterium TMED214]|nr:MAG: hypothetical protein CBD74_13980 [Saprospirales bacterium TMED214]